MATQYDVRDYSWGALQRAAHEPIGKAWAPYTPSSIREGSSDRWDCGFSYDDMCAVLDGHKEWSDGRRAIEKQASEQATKQIRMHPAKDYMPADSGDFFDVAAIAENLPEQWLALQETPNASTDRSILNLVVNISASCGIDAGMLQDRMRAICAAILTLESFRVPVALCTLMCTQSHRTTPQRMANIVRIKEAGHPIDMHRIVTIAHPAYFRRIGFRLIEQTPRADFASAFSSGYGYPSDPTPEEMRSWTGYGEAVYFPAMRLRGGGVQETIERLQSILTQRTGIRFDAEGDDYRE